MTLAVLEDEDKWGGELIFAIPTSLARLFNSELLGVQNILSWDSDLMTSFTTVTKVGGVGGGSALRKSGGD